MIVFVFDVWNLQLLKTEEKKVNPREVAQKIIDNLPPCDLIGKVWAKHVRIVFFIILLLFVYGVAGISYLFSRLLKIWRQMKLLLV